MTRDRAVPEPEKPSLTERVKASVMKPVEVSPADANEPMSETELEEAVSFATDKERLIGLIAAPLAAAVSILVMTALIDNDPPARLKDGAVNSSHVSLSLYHDLILVLLGLSLAMLITAMARKRLLLGIVMALYGLAVFNLHYWGFGLPFLLGGAWYLVRAYRLQKDLKLAASGGPVTVTPVNPHRRKEQALARSKR